MVNHLQAQTALPSTLPPAKYRLNHCLLYVYVCILIEANVHFGVEPRLPKRFSLEMSYFVLDEEFLVSLC